MTLGGLNNKMGYVPAVESDFDFTSLQSKVNSIEQKQNFILIGLALLIILTLTKK